MLSIDEELVLFLLLLTVFLPSSLPSLPSSASSYIEETLQMDDDDDRSLSSRTFIMEGCTQCIGGT